MHRSRIGKWMLDFAWFVVHALREECRNPTFSDCSDPQGSRTRLPNPLKFSERNKKSRRTGGILHYAETRGFEPPKGLTPYLISSEAHSTGLCDVSNEFTDYPYSGILAKTPPNALDSRPVHSKMYPCRISESPRQLPP